MRIRRFLIVVEDINMDRAAPATSISNDLQDENIDLYSATFISTDYKKSSKGTCPEHFTRVAPENTPSDLPCAQGWQENLVFLGLDSDENDPPFFTSPVDNSQHTIEYGNDVPFDKVEFHYGIYRFTKQKCQDSSDCEESKGSFASEDIDILYDRENPICFPATSSINWDKTGCALPVVLSNKTGCVDDDQRLVCSFVPFFSEYVLPPVTYTWAGFWGWGIIGYFNCLFIFLFLALVHGRNMHVFYLGNYYFFQNFVTLKAGVRYDYKLKIRGQQYTTSEGHFSVSTPSNNLHTHHLQVTFPASELEGSRQGCVVVRGSIVPPVTTEGVQMDILWEQQFQEADSSTPITDITVRIHLPVWLKTRWNILFMPFIVFYGVCIKRLWRKPQLVKKYKLLEITCYITLVHLTWILTIIYIMFYFIPWGDNNHVFWGDLNHRPPLPMFLYVLFLCIMTLCIIFALFGSRRYFRPSRKRVTHSSGKILKLTHMTMDLGVEKGDPDEESVDFCTLQYVPLNRMPAQVEHGHVYTEEGSYMFRKGSQSSPIRYSDDGDDF